MVQIGRKILLLIGLFIFFGFGAATVSAMSDDSLAKTEEMPTAEETTVPVAQDVVSIEITDGISATLQNSAEEGFPAVLTEIIVSGLEKVDPQSGENSATKYLITYKNSSGESVEYTLDLSSGRLMDVAGKEYSVKSTDNIVFLSKDVTAQ